MYLSLSFKLIPAKALQLLLLLCLCGLVALGAGASKDTSIAPLPVRLSSFEAGLFSPGKTLVQWHTAEQWTQIYYEVQRAADNYDFKTVGIVLPPDDRPITRGYAFKDNLGIDANASVLFYRLRQVNQASGSVSYSYTIILRLKESKKAIAKAWPNPFSQSFDVNVFTDEVSDIQLKLIDGSGKIVARKTNRSVKGMNTYKLEGMRNLSAGLYSLQVWKNGELAETQKITKLSE